MAQAPKSSVSEIRRRHAAFISELKAKQGRTVTVGGRVTVPRSFVSGPAAAPFIDQPVKRVTPVGESRLEEVRRVEAERKEIIAGRTKDAPAIEDQHPLAYARAYGGRVTFTPERYTVRDIQKGKVSVEYRTGRGDVITFKPTAPKPSRIRRLGEIAGVVLPAGYKLEQGIPREILYPREVKDYSYKKETIAAGIPTATEILSMAAIVRQIAGTVKGVGKIKQVGEATRIDIVTASKIPRTADVTFDISRQYAKDISKTISKGAGRGIVVEAKAGKDIVTTVASVGAAEEVGAARLVQAGASREIGAGFISQSYLKELTKTLYRKGIKIGVPAEEVLPVAKRLKKQRVIAAAIPTEEGVTILATAKDPVITKVLTPKGIIPRARFIPDIRIDLAYGKFPDIKRILDVQKIKPTKIKELRLLPAGKKAQVLLTPQVQKAIVSQLAVLPKTATVLRPTLAPLVRPLSIPRVSQQAIVTPRIIQIPRVTPKVRQISRPIITTRLKQVPKLAQVPRAAVQVRQISRQLGRLAQVPRLTPRLTTRLRIQQRISARPTAAYGLPRIITPRIAIPPIIIPKFDFKRIKTPKLKKKKRKARDDYGISETFVQRQLLLPIAKPLRIRRLKI